MFRSLHFASLKVIFLAGAALAATRVARQDPSQPASSPVLILPSLDPVTACKPVNIAWVYEGPNDPLTLIVSNGDVDQVAPPSPPESVSNTFSDNVNTMARRAVPTGASRITKSIATVLPQDKSYNWTQVDVPQGWYRLIGIMPSSNYDSRSLDFYVSELGDTTCLLTTSSSSSPPLSSPTPTPTGSSPPTSPTPPPSPSQSPPQTSTPVFGASSSVNTGAIAGGVVGGAALLAIFLVVYLCLLRSKRRSKQPHSPRSRGLQSAGGWGGLASIDSHLDPAGRKPKPKPKPYAGIRHQSQTDSLGPIIPGVGAASEENIQAYRAGGTFSPSEEKVGLGEVGIGVLPYSQSTRPGVGRTYSASSVASTNEFAMGRRPSINSTTALPPGARRSSIEYPPPAVSQMDRAPSGASSQQQPQQRKTPRKPVPAYSPGSGSSPSSSSPSPIATSPTTPPSGSPFDDDRVQRRVSGGSTGHYAARARDGSRDRGGKDGKERSRGRDAGGEDGPVLSHKSSFGPGGVEGKPLHYLIPDMPPRPVA